MESEKVVQHHIRHAVCGMKVYQEQMFVLILCGHLTASFEKTSTNHKFQLLVVIKQAGACEVFNNINILIRRTHFLYTTKRKRYLNLHSVAGLFNKHTLIGQLC